MNRGSPRPFSVPVREVAETQATNYLRKAESHLASAIEAQAASRWDTAVLLSVHAAISAGDAACVAIAGIRSINQTHMDQPKLIRQMLAAKCTDQAGDRSLGKCR